MAKIRTKLKANPSTPPHAIIVDSPSEVTGPCLKVLRTLLKNPSIAFHETPQANNEVKCGLTGSPVQAIARDKYSVFLLLSAAELFWLGTTLVFKRELGRYHLMSASLVIFKGDTFDEKTPLLRAEWDNPDPTTTIEHAQPHWHVYPRFINRDWTNSQMVDTVTFQSFDLTAAGATHSDVEDLAWPTSANFHYAMASTWHSEANGCQEKLNELSRLLGWLTGCISYSRNQLNFLFS